MPAGMDACLNPVVRVKTSTLLAGDWLAHPKAETSTATIATARMTHFPFLFPAIVHLTQPCGCRGSAVRATALDSATVPSNSWERTGRARSPHLTVDGR